MSPRGKRDDSNVSTVDATFVRRKTERDGGAWAVSVTEDPALTIVGPMLDPRPGSRVRLSGCTESNHPTFGKQVKYRSYEWLGFADRRGIVKFLVDSCAGIGPRTAERIVDAFGDRAIDVLRETPRDVCASVRGLDPEIADAAAEQLMALERDSKMLSVLRGGGLGPKLAQRVVQAYEPDQLAEVLAKDPWRISDEVDQVGFKTADQLALSLGHPQDSPLRARSGLRHFVEESASSDGHVILPASTVWAKAAACGIPETAFNAAVIEPIDVTRVARVLVGDTDPPTGIGSPNLALASLHAAERLIAERVRHLANARPPALDWDQDALDSYVGSLRARNGSFLSLDPTQQAAILGVQKKRIVVVTGGPGTGKSFLLQAMYRAVCAGNRVRVVAPTGKAAVRLKSSKPTIPASTIHLALLREAKCDHDPNDEEERNECRAAGRGHKQLDCDVLMIDESSMVSSDIMAWLLGSLRPDCSVILFGDIDQLPPVGPGSPFRDIIESGKVPVHRLDVVHRTDREWLKANARAINSGQMPRWGGDVDDFFLMERANDGEAAEAADLIVDLVARRLPAKYCAAPDSDPLDDIQVLAPMRERGRCGVIPLNDAIRDAINPATSALGPLGFRSGDKVIQTKNDYDLGVMNGEIGRVVALGKKGDPISDAHTREFKVDRAKNGTATADWIACDFDHGDPVVYGSESARQLALAYAITTHKSQGSSWPIVVVPVVKNHGWMTTRKLLYTAITRAEKMAILVGEVDAVRAAIRNVRDDARDTLVKRWLQNGMVGFLPTNAARKTIEEPSETATAIPSEVDDVAP